MDYGFLDKPVQDWPNDDRYLRSKEVVNNLSVVNDGTERGVKLAYDFVDGVKKENNLQNILQVVENDRNMVPNQIKRKMKSKS